MYKTIDFIRLLVIAGLGLYFLFAEFSKLISSDEPLSATAMSGVAVLIGFASKM